MSLGAMDILVFEEVGPAQQADLARFFTENNNDRILRTFNPFPLTAAMAEQIACAPRRDRYYAALLTGRIVGLSMLRGWDEGYTVPSIGMFVDYRLHGRGLGAQLFDYTIQAAADLGCRRIRLTTYASNVGPNRLYAARGFVEDSRQPVQMGSEPDAKILMFKELA